MPKNPSKIKKATHDPSLALDFIKNQINMQLSKTFLGNSAGLSNNIRGYLQQKKAKKVDIKKLPLSSGYEFGTKLLSEGHVNMGNLFEPELITQISKKFQELIENPKYSFVRAKRENHVFSRFLYRTGEAIPETLELINEKVISAMETYYKSHFKITHFTFYRNYHIPANLLGRTDIINNRWHCDPINTSWVKLFVYFKDVTEQDGPFHVQTLERTKELMRLGYKTRFSYNLPDDIIEDENHIWRATGKQGFAVMCNCNLGLHKAGIPEPDHSRDCVRIQFAPSTEPLPKNWYDKFIDFDEELLHKSSKNSNIPVPD